jgi:hypothetical protein
MTNVAGLGGSNVSFSLTNGTATAFTVEYSTNLTDWHLLGSGLPRYPNGFIDSGGRERLHGIVTILEAIRSRHIHKNGNGTSSAWRQTPKLTSI